jgi:predicted transcriptional regulator
MKIAEIMTKQVHTIGPDRTLKECADILKKHHVNGLVVIGWVKAGKKVERAKSAEKP